MKEILEMGENDIEEQKEETESEPAKPINLAQPNPPKQELIDPSMVKRPVFEKLIENNQIMVCRNRPKNMRGQPSTSWQRARFL